MYRVYLKLIFGRYKKKFFHYSSTFSSYPIWKRQTSFTFFLGIITQSVREMVRRKKLYSNISSQKVFSKIVRMSLNYFVEKPYTFILQACVL